jgi:hypothetical protein
MQALSAHEYVKSRTKGFDIKLIVAVLLMPRFIGDATDRITPLKIRALVSGRENSADRIATDRISGNERREMVEHMEAFFPLFLTPCPEFRFCLWIGTKDRLLILILSCIDRSKLTDGPRNLLP